MLSTYTKDGGNSIPFRYQDDTDQALAFPSITSTKPRKEGFPEGIEQRAREHARDPSLNRIQGRHSRHDIARVLIPITPKDKEWPCPEKLRIDRVDAMHRAWKLSQKLRPTNKTFADDIEYFVIGQAKPIFLTIDSLRQFIVDSGASYHLISPKDLTEKEYKTVRKAEPMGIRTASKVEYVDKVADVYVQRDAAKSECWPAQVLVLAEYPALNIAAYLACRVWCQM